VTYQPSTGCWRQINSACTALVGFGKHAGEARTWRPAPPGWQQDRSTGFCSLTVEGAADAVLKKIKKLLKIKGFRILAERKGDSNPDRL
jgi:hypothetical protein